MASRQGTAARPNCDGPARTPARPPTQAPRTGNRAFARDFNAAVPDSWQVVNGQDVVANQAKFLVSRASRGGASLSLGVGCFPFAACRRQLPTASWRRLVAQVLFKRPGKPVLLTRRGDLIVRPSTIEHTAHR